MIMCFPWLLCIGTAAFAVWAWMTGHYIVGAFFTLVHIFVDWRIWSVFAGIDARDSQVRTACQPLLTRVQQREPVTVDEVLALANRPELRHFLFNALREFQREDLFPHDFDDIAAQGAASLAYWMMHPNELEEPPEKIELAAQVERTVDCTVLKFFVYRFKMREGHWEGQKWILGITGPMRDIAPAYAKMHPAFARCGDIDGKANYNEIVNWWVKLNVGK